MMAETAKPYILLDPGIRSIYGLDLKAELASIAAFLNAASGPCTQQFALIIQSC